MMNSPTMDITMDNTLESVMDAQPQTNSSIRKVCFKLSGSYFALGNIHVLRKHKGGREGVSQMLMFAYGGVKGHAYVIIAWEKNAE